MGTGWIISRGITTIVFCATLFLAGCVSQSPLPAGTDHGLLALTSDAFPANGTMPVQYTCDGQGESPSLAWRNVPAGTRSFALIFEDPDAPAGTYTHWVLYNIPGEQRELPSGIPPVQELPGGGFQGINSNQRYGYIGPCPPRGSTHRYILTVWALDTRVDPFGSIDAGTLRNAMEGHILASGQLTGTCMRQ
jgi:Raf kinase inhibitor-like YbhB/YbcL family protein